MGRKDQIQQITEQIRRRTTAIGKVKPKYIKQVALKPEIISSDTGDKSIVPWAKWWFVPNVAFYGNYICKNDFDAWIRGNSDMHFGTIDTDGITLHDGSITRYAHMYYALEVRSESPKQIRIDIDTAYKISLLVDNQAILAGTYQRNHRTYVTIPGGNVWIPIEIYAYNPYETDHPNNDMKIKLDLVGTFGMNNIRTQVPAIPENFSASNGIYSDRILLTWSLNRQMTDQDKVQIWRTADLDSSWEPIGSVDGNLTSYTDLDVYEGDQFYYKARFVTREGGISNFTNIVTGTVGSMTGSLVVTLSQNESIADEDTIGFYKTSDTVTATIYSSTAVYEDSVAVELQYPTTSGIGYYRVPIGISGLAEYNGTNSWTVDIEMSGIAASGYDITDGRAKLIAFGYMPGVSPNGWMGPAGTAGTLLGIKGFVIDDHVPQVSFFIDYDRNLDVEDTFTYSTNVALKISDLSDPSTYAKPYYNPDGDEFEIGYVNGRKYASEVYEIRFANSELTLTGTDPGTGDLTTPWRKQAEVGRIIDPYYLDTVVQGETKYVFMQIRDKSGNESLIASDSITYIEGLPTVENVNLTEHYEYLDITWDEVTYSEYVDGYYIYRNTSDTQTTVPYATIRGNAVTRYRDIYPAAGTSATYYYWVKAFIGEGQGPESYIVSTEYSDSVNGSLKTDPPDADQFILIDPRPDRIYMQFKTPASSNSEQEAKEHMIYRCEAGIEDLDSSELLITLPYIDSETIFEFTDTSAEVGYSYQYASIARNGPWLDSSTYYTQTNTINWTTEATRDVTPPPMPIWASGDCYAGYGYNKLVANGVDDSLDSLDGYNLYRILLKNLEEPGGAHAISSEAVIETGGALLTFYKERIENRDITWIDKVGNEGFGNEYAYWISSVNVYGYESNCALLTGLGLTNANYATLFANYLDNSSFERPIDTSNNTWVLNSYATRELNPNALQHGAYQITIRETDNIAYWPLTYEYIFAQQAMDYTLSFYMRDDPDGDGLEDANYVAVCVEWWKPDNTYNTTEHYINGTSVSNEWTRYSFDLTAPASTVKARLKVRVYGGTTDYVDFDAFQWEETTDASPTDYVDSRSISADRIGAHIIRGDMIEAETITGGLIQFGTLVGDHMQVGSIQLDRLESIPVSTTTNYSLTCTGIQYNNLYTIDLTEDSPDPPDYFGTPKTYSGTDPVNTYWNSIQPDNWTVSQDGKRIQYTGNSINDRFIYGTFNAESPPSTCYLTISDTYPAGDEVDFILARVVYGSLRFTTPGYSGPGVQIEGSDIVAGYINAERIEAHSITTDHIEVGVVPKITESLFRFESRGEGTRRLLIRDLSGGMSPQVRLRAESDLLDIDWSTVQPNPDWVRGGTLSIRGPIASSSSTGYYIIYATQEGDNLFLKVANKNQLPGEEYDFVIGRIYVPLEADQNGDTCYSVEPTDLGGIIMDGNKIVAGTINAEEVRMRSDTSKVSIDKYGIKVGDESENHIHLIQQSIWSVLGSSYWQSEYSHGSRPLTFNIYEATDGYRWNKFNYGTDVITNETVNCIVHHSEGHPGIENAGQDGVIGAVSYTRERTYIYALSPERSDYTAPYAKWKAKYAWLIDYYNHQTECNIPFCAGTDYQLQVDGNENTNLYDANYEDFITAISADNNGTLTLCVGAMKYSGTITIEAANEDVIGAEITWQVAICAGEDTDDHDKYDVLQVNSGTINVTLKQGEAKTFEIPSSMLRSGTFYEYRDRCMLYENIAIVGHLRAWYNTAQGTPSRIRLVAITPSVMSPIESSFIFMDNFLSRNWTYACPFSGTLLFEVN